MQTALDRPNLSETVATRVRDMIVDGRLAPGERVNEVRLAARLGISRTPLREALSALAAEGALASSPRIGYFIAPLTLEEFDQIYPIRATLDPEALRLAGLPPPDHLERLQDLNRKIRAARDVEKAILLDNHWHLELLARCPNRVLIGLIKQFMGRTHRYEIALLREEQNLRISAAEHNVILAALQSRNLKKACRALRRNMQSGIEPIRSWLKSRAASATPSREVDR
jgi:DNA-binding GntR family transcriptional regulator